MENSSNSSMERAVTAMLRIPPIVHRKILREIFSRAIHRTEFGIAQHHAMIMKMLQESGTLSSSEIGAITSISKAQMTQSIKKLVTMGLIEKQADARDRRRLNLRLTPKGQATIRSMDELMFDLLKERLSGLSEEELKKLAIAHEEIAEILSNL